MARQVTKQENELQAADSVLRPAVDVYEDGTGITLYADVPGASKDKLSLNMDGHILSVEAEAELRLPEEINATYAEVRSPRYRRSFTLSQDLDTDKIDANLNDGVLKVFIPKHESAKPRRIEVKVG